MAHLVQFTYYANLNGTRVCTGAQEVEVEHQTGLEFEIENEQYDLKMAQRYDEVDVSCATLDFCTTLR